MRNEKGQFVGKGTEAETIESKLSCNIKSNIESLSISLNAEQWTALHANERLAIIIEKLENVLDIIDARIEYLRSEI